MANEIQKASSYIFREYDIRGCVGKDYSITNNYNIGRSIATYFKQQKPFIKNVIVGMDGRIHSAAIKEEICKAFLDSGINVLFIGLCSTPAFYFANHILNTEGGVMITASHNPKEDNGLKIILERQPVWSQQIKTICDIYNNDLFLNEKVKGHYQEKIINEYYVDFLVKNFGVLIGKSLNCAIDCGNGSAGTAIPMLVKKMQWKNVILLNENVDGNFPDHEPDPSVEKNLITLKKCVQQHHLDFGLALDGDCDRFVAITKDGTKITSDQLIGLFSLSISNKTAVFDIMCSNQILEQFNAYGIKTYLTKTGCSNIKECMKQNNVLLGGELSGHYCFKDKYFGYDDGIYALIRFIEIVNNSKKSVEQLLEQFPNTNLIFSCSINSKEEKKFQIIEEIKKIFQQKSNYNVIDIDGIRATNEFGCAILRASNTEPILRLKLEAKNEENLKNLKLEFYEILSNYFDKNEIIKLS